MARTSRQWDRSEVLAERLHWHVHSGLWQEADCSLVIFRLLEQTAPSGVSGGASACDALPALAERIRPHIRRTDAMELDEGNALMIVLHTTSREGAHAVLQRLRERLTTPALPGEVSLAFIIGYATNTATAGQKNAITDVIRDAWKPRSLMRVALPSPQGRSGPCAGDAEARGARPRARRPAAASFAATRPARASRRPLLRLVTHHQAAEPVDESLRERAQTLGVPYVRLPPRLPASCRGAIPLELSRELGAVPIGRSRNRLTVAMYDPSDAGAMLRLRAATGFDIFPVLAAPDQLARALRQLARG